MRNDDMEMYEEELDEQELLYEINRLQKRLDRMESFESAPERDLTDEINRLTDEINFMKKERTASGDEGVRYRRSESYSSEDERIARILERLENAPSSDDLSKAALALRKGAQMLERSSGEKIANELLALKNVVTSCPTMVMPAPKKDEIFSIKQFFELKKLLGGFDEKYEKHIADASVQIDELYSTRETVASVSVPFIEKLFAILNLYNLINDNDAGREIVENYNIMVNDFFNQNLNSEKIEKIFYINEVSAIYKISDVIKAKAKKFYALYDEVLAAKPAKQFDLIRQIYEIKTDLCGRTDECDAAYSKLKEICGKNASLADIRLPLNELMVLPMKNIMPPPIITPNAKSVIVSPTVSLSDAIKRLTELVEKNMGATAPVAEVSSVKDGEIASLDDKLGEIQIAISGLNKSEPSGNQEGQEILDAIRLLREEIADISAKLEAQEEEKAHTQQAAQEAAAATVIAPIEETREEIDLSDGASEKLDQILASLERLKDGPVSHSEPQDTLQTAPQAAPAFDSDELKADIVKIAQETILSGFEQIKREFDEAVNGLSTQMSIISHKIESINSSISEIKAVENSILEQSASDKTGLANGLEEVRADIKANNKAVADQLKTVKKDVESIKERNQKITAMSRQMETVKTKVDTLYKTNKPEKDAEITKQLKTLQTSLDKMGAPSKKSPAKSSSKAVKKDDDVSKTVSSLKKDLNEIMDIINEDNFQSPPPAEKTEEQKAE